MLESLLEKLQTLGVVGVDFVFDADNPYLATIHLPDYVDTDGEGDTPTQALINAYNLWLEHGPSNVLQRDWISHL